jgi:hypothetical protein
MIRDKTTSGSANLALKWSLVWDIALRSDTSKMTALAVVPVVESRMKSYTVLNLDC